MSTQPQADDTDRYVAKLLLRTGAMATLPKHIEHGDLMYALGRVCGKLLTDDLIITDEWASFGSWAVSATPEQILKLIEEST